MNRLYLRMGEIAVCPEPTLITTVLGSCVSICLWDTRLTYGGMNHFRAPIVPDRQEPSGKYGETATRILMERMSALGSRKRDLIAMVFGGGAVIEQAEGQINIGKENVIFARSVLKKEGITIRRTNTGRGFGRKIVFNTLTGSASVTSVKPAGSFKNQKR